MITIYTVPGCGRCKKLKSWLKENEIPFQEELLYRLLLDDQKLMGLLTDYADSAVLETAFSERADDGSLQNETSKDRAVIISERWQNNPALISRPLIVLTDEDKPEIKEQQSLLKEYLTNPLFSNICNSCQEKAMCLNPNKEKEILILDQSDEL